MYYIPKGVQLTSIKSVETIEDTEYVESTDATDVTESLLNIRIGKHVIRRLDNYNIVVQEVKVSKEGKNVGNEYYVTIGYYKELLGAIKKVLLLETNNKVIKELKDVKGALQECEANIINALDKQYTELKGL